MEFINEEINVYKIKDNVDLKELEKYGYRIYDEYSDELIYYKTLYSNYEPNDGYSEWFSLCVDATTRKIFINSDWIDEDYDIDKCLIKDLIEANLIEEVKLQ